MKVNSLMECQGSQRALHENYSAYIKNLLKDLDVFSIREVKIVGFLLQHYLENYLAVLYTTSHVEGKSGVATWFPHSVPPSS